MSEPHQPVRIKDQHFYSKFLWGTQASHPLSIAKPRLSTNEIEFCNSFYHSPPATHDHIEGLKRKPADKYKAPPSGSNSLIYISHGTT